MKTKYMKAIKRKNIFLLVFGTFLFFLQPKVCAYTTIKNNESYVVMSEKEDMIICAVFLGLGFINGAATVLSMEIGLAKNAATFLWRKLSSNKRKDPVPEADKNPCNAGSLNRLFPDWEKKLNLTEKKN